MSTNAVEEHPEGARKRDPKPPQDGASVKSCKSAGSSSTRSSRLSVSAAAARARAKAEAARARVAFTQREISIKVDKARLEANLEALNIEKEAAAAIAQAEVLEAAAELENEEHRSWKSLPIMVQSTHERVSDYIRDQTMQLNQRTVSANLSQISEHPMENTLQPSPKYIIKDEYVRNDCHPPPLQLQPSSAAPHAYQTGCTSTPSVKPDTRDHLQAQNEVLLQEPNGSMFHPKPMLTFPQHGNTLYTDRSESSVMMDMAKYLARKELVSTGLSHFDDRPESYRAWKSAFSNTIKDLDLTASEQLDLLSKWLGKDSSVYVKRLRAVHIDNPQAGLIMAWDRLDECYGAPEVIENALFKRLDSFPGLAYLDTAHGIKPIVEKLPYNLQEKWITQGSKYKEDHKVGYPPFSFFTSFYLLPSKNKERSQLCSFWKQPSDRQAHLTSHKFQISSLGT